VFLLRSPIQTLKGHAGTVDANVFQRSVDFPKDHLPCHHVLLDNHLVITINVNQVEPLESPAGGASESSKEESRECLEYLRLLLV